MKDVRGLAFLDLGARAACEVHQDQSRESPQPRLAPPCSMRGAYTRRARATSLHIRGGQASRVRMRSYIADTFFPDRTKVMLLLVFGLCRGCRASPGPEAWERGRTGGGASSGRAGTAPSGLGRERGWRLRKQLTQLGSTSLSRCSCEPGITRSTPPFPRPWMLPPRNLHRP